MNEEDKKVLEGVKKVAEEIVRRANDIADEMGYPGYYGVVATAMAGEASEKFLKLLDVLGPAGMSVLGDALRKAEVSDTLAEAERIINDVD